MRGISFDIRDFDFGTLPRPALAPRYFVYDGHAVSLWCKST